MEYINNGPFIRRDGAEIDVELKGKVIGLYFSAHWCPPCQQFTPLLAKLHGELKNRSAPFEVVFVSFDKTQESMAKYMNTMHGDWLAVPFGDPRIRKLQDHFETSAVPKLFILHEDGSIITSTGRKEVQDKGVAAFRGWQDAAHLSIIKQSNRATPEKDADS